jgi:hypothetical protein
MNKQLNSRNPYGKECLTKILMSGSGWAGEVLWIGRKGRVLFTTVAPHRIRGAVPKRRHIPGIPDTFSLSDWTWSVTEKEVTVRVEGQDTLLKFPLGRVR